MKTLSKFFLWSALNFAGGVAMCHLVFVAISWVQIIFSWVFRGFKLFSRGYFVGLKCFLVGISKVQNFFSWVFLGPEIFFVGSKFSLLGNFIIFSCWPHEKKWRRNTSETTYSFPNRFQQFILDSAIYVQQFISIIFNYFH